ncbi:MAG TPA: hypothetical protein PLP29_00915 [Candidatus Ozemobacteraceae bacterium]|nr:hypothetical protein [Candidatus Ozemobacteraceae bacterium]
MDALSNILLRRYQQRAYLMTGFALPAPLSSTQATGGAGLTGVQALTGAQPLTSLTRAQQPEQTGFGLSTGGALSAISAMGRQMNEFSRTLGTNDEARAGLRAFALEIGRDTTATGPLTALNDLRSMQIQDPKNFASAFEVAGQYAGVGGSASAFLRTVAAEKDTGLRSSMIGAIDSSLGMQGTNAERRQLAGGVLSTISNIRENTAKTEETGAIKKFLSKLQTYDTLGQRSEFIQIFNRKDQSIFQA